MANSRASQIALYTFVVLLNVACIWSEENPVPLTFPCPLESEFHPCICTEDENLSINADCSAAINNNDLIKAFSAMFPFDTFDNLIIDHKDCTNCDLTVLDQLSFGPVSFEHVAIKNTALRTIENAAFQMSENTLKSLNLAHNKINYFEFEAIGQFLFLTSLNLGFNKFTKDPPIPDITSASLKTIDLQENDLAFDALLVRECPELRKLILKNTQTSSIPMEILDTIGMFHALHYIEDIDFSHNTIPALLAANIQGTQGTLANVKFASNNISELHAGFVKGFGPQASLNMAGNEIRTLDETVWSGIVGELLVIGSGKINLDNNPLACGCDIAWLVRDPTLMNVIVDTATCADNITLLHSISEDIIHDCPVHSLAEHP